VLRRALTTFWVRRISRGGIDTIRFKFGFAPKEFDAAFILSQAVVTPWSEARSSVEPLANPWNRFIIVQALLVIACWCVLRE
jgi:hypothetical protein